VAEAAPARVLDVGCGTGDFTERVRQEAGVDLLALDRSPRMAELTRRRGIGAVTADIPSIPFAEGTFDSVLANRVLYHVLDLDRGLGEIARVLRPGGRLVAVTYSEDHLGELFDLVGRSPDPETFSAESGAASLRSHFDPVERRDITGTARFATVSSILRGLEAYGEFAWFSDIDLDARLAGVQVPFDVSYRHCIFVAHKPR